MGATNINVQYQLDIREHNVRAHTDIEHAIQAQKDGLFTFILRVDNGNVVDFNVVEVTDAREYLVLKKITIQELSISSYPLNGSEQNSIRTDNSQREDQRRSGTVGDDKYSEVKTEKIPTT